MLEPGRYGGFHGDKGGIRTHGRYGWWNAVQHPVGLGVERRYLILAPLLDAGNWCYVGLGPTEMSLTQDSRPALFH